MNIPTEPPGGLDAPLCEVMDLMPVMIWVSGRDKLCTWFNRPWLDFTGRTLDQEIGEGWAEGVHQDDLKKCVHVYSSHFDKRRQFRMRYRLRSRDGEHRWIEDTGFARYARDGAFLGYIGWCTDVEANQNIIQDKLNIFRTQLGREIAELKALLGRPASAA